MADAIVQTIKIQVEGTEEAAAEFKKVGEAGTQAFSETEKAAEGAGKSVADAGKQASGGMDEMSKSAGVSSREMKALSKVMGSFGAGEAGQAAFGFYRVATSLGAVGVAALAVGKGISLVVEAIKEAAETSKAMEHIGKISAGSAESLQSLQVAFSTVGVKAKDLDKSLSALALRVAETAEKGKPDWIKEWANDIDAVTNKLTNLSKSIPQQLSPLTSTATLTAGFEKFLTQAAGETKTFADGTSAVVLNMDKAVRATAELYQTLNPITKLQFDKVLAGFFTPEQLALIQKGPAAIDAITARLATLGGQLEATATSGKTIGDRLIAISALQSDAAVGLEKIGAAGQKASAGFRDWDEVVKELTSGFKTMTDDEAALAAKTAAMAPAAQATGTAFQNLAQAVDASIAQVKAAIESWVTTPAANAWVWIADTYNSAVAAMKPAADAVTQFIASWVTTPIASAWAWIVDAWNAMLAKLGFGGEKAAPATSGGSGFARGGLLGGRGSGTSDSNLAWVSRGEFIVPAHAVRAPGVLNFLEALRLAGGNLRGLLDGMHFAAGGLIMPRAVPAFAGGGGVPRNLGRLELALTSGTVSVYTDEQAVKALKREAALGQVRSGGRKPSRYS